MTPFTWALVGAAIVLIAVWPASQRLRHPQVQPLAAYLIFLTVLVMVGGALLALAGWLVSLLGLRGLLPPGGWTVAGTLLVAAGGGLVAAYAVSREPRRRKVRPD